MSVFEVPTYVTTVPLPAALGAAAPFTSYTDPNGDVWVAQGGVYNGAWKRAKDVLVGAYYRSAAWTTATTTTLLVFDTLDYDPYGLYGRTTSGTLDTPVAGIWRFDETVSATATATGQWVQCRIDVTGRLGAGYGIAHASMATWAQAVAWCQRKMAATDAAVFYQASNVASLAGRVDVGNTKMSFAYLGTG